MNKAKNNEIFNSVDKSVFSDYRDKFTSFGTDVFSNSEAGVSSNQSLDKASGDYIYWDKQSEPKQRDLKPISEAKSRFDVFTDEPKVIRHDKMAKKVFLLPLEEGQNFHLNLMTMVN